ncbi:1-acylglycerol-3-phosphate O-acyltransferase PNPLA3 isoform X1 [Zalophus californianus]|uniref:Acylglycerol transacylase n=1 Tax=Zalophus californianus TaxID=9704 RepID=A0A6J2D1C4_ZALCA|nr:1-acylglycerol-3-phosphate O-acyltransferase PNPLA3 isoform X1 [Zalophus californianus]XP_027971432.1 1-acylglycerol-3-phosphate O-acyltransferase PNPLA3 isoform X2 [Eumetopias jubatus]
MYDPERGWSLSFSGCGFLGFYHIGATRCLSEHAPHLIRDARMLFGSSAGALHAVVFLSGISLDLLMQILVDIVQSARSRNIGTLHPSFNLGRHIQKSLQRHLPDNIHRLISGKMCISLTRVSDGENVLVSDFQSKDEVVDALLCSSFIPFFCGIIPPSFRGVRYMDGGASDNVPFFDAKTTITVSPFYGEYDICPKVMSTNFLHVDLTKLSLRLCSENAYLLMRALFPPDLKVLGEICLRGYLDALRFLEENGICNRPHPCLNLPSEELKILKFTWGHRSLESPPRAAAGRMKPKGDELLDHLRLSILPWDESILDTLSPKLTAALSKAVKNQRGYMSKICNFLPIKVMSYMVLPCTLPVESAIAVVQRLVMWLPDMPEDIRWLQWLTSSVCSQVMTQLFPISRSQTPASGQQPSPRDMKALLPSLLSNRGRS